MIVLMAGLPGTGKTTLAHALAERTSGRVISKDDVRHALFEPAEIEYSTRQDDFCQQVMMETARYLLERRRGLMVFLDGRPFSRRYQIENALALAASLNQPWRVLECVCPEDVAVRRVAEQMASGNHPAENRDARLYAEVKARFETIVLPKTVIDTSQPLASSLEQGLAALQ